MIDKYTGEKICVNECEYSNNCIFSTVSDLTTATAPNFNVSTNNRQDLICFTYKMKGDKMDTIIKAKVEEFIANRRMFTSVNISNAIKTDGKWVRNRDVATWLRNNFDSVNTALSTDYVSVQISVGTLGDQANLYLPVSFDSQNYTDTNLQCMTPDEFKTLHGFDPLSTTVQSPISVQTAAQVTPTAPSGQIVTGKSSFSGFRKMHKIREFKKGRIRIPAPLVQQIGLKPYNTVKFDKIDVDQTCTPKTLRVHSDGRISLPRKCIKVDGTPVTTSVLLAFIENDMIKFTIA
jgi:hypothetical protein